MLCQVPSASGAPRDPFAAALPGRDTQAEEGGASLAGDGSVSEQQGSASHSVPIAVPPGRLGMAPALALSYSSDAPVRGGIAAGWSLELPTIERDRSAPAQVRYRLSMPGSSGILVPVTGDPQSGYRYRVEIDDQFARVEKVGAAWIVSTPDGRVRGFAASTSASDLSTRWNLTSEKDAFGNEIKYTWAPVQVGAYKDFVLTLVEYTSNSAAGLAAHAKVELTWADDGTCPSGTLPKGAQTDHHFGAFTLRGSRRLDKITSSVRDTPGSSWRVARRMTLSYDADALTCLDGPPLRFLQRVDVRAWDAVGATTDAPPMQFGYGPRQPTYPDTTLLPGVLENGSDAGPETTRMDLDGDAIPDQVRVFMPAPGSGVTRCQLGWRKGTFGGGLAQQEEVFSLPTAQWRNGAPGEGDACTLNGQLAVRSSDTYNTSDGSCTTIRGVQVAYQFMDWDHDGDLDLVTGNWATGNTDACGPDFSDGTCAIETDNGEGGQQPCTNGEGGDCTCPQGEEYDPGAGACHPPCGAGQEWNGSVCVDSCDDFSSCSGWDNGDGPLDEPVAPNPPGSDCPLPSPSFEGVWRVFENDPRRPTGRFDPTSHGRYTLPVALPLNGGVFAPSLEAAPGLPSTVDIDGDGRLDVIELNTANLGTATKVRVFRGSASGTFAANAELWDKITWVQQTNKSLWSQAGYPVYGQGALELADVNGDGLQDLVVWASPSGSTTYRLRVAYNLGTSFTSLVDLAISGPVAQSRSELSGAWLPFMPLTQGWRADERRLVDVDGDGLPEVVVLEASGSVTGQAPLRRIYRIHGDRLVADVAAASELEAYERLTRAINRKSWYRVSDVSDVTGDGVPDLVTANWGGYLTVRTGHGRPPMRLLTSVDNGRGAVTTFEYGQATDPSLVTVADGDVGATRWLVRKVTVAPGGGQPAMVTRYAYERPVTGQESALDVGPPRFLGFAKVSVFRSGQRGDDSARTTLEYAYAHGPDRRGHLTVERVDAVGADGVLAPISVTTRQWQNRTMMGGATSATFNVETRHEVLGGGASFTRTVQVWSPSTWAATGRVTHYENTETTEEDESGRYPHRATVRGFARRFGQSPYAASDYRVLQVLEERQLRYDTIGFTMASSYTYYNTAGLPYRTQLTTGTDTASTDRTFELTGLVSTVKRPRQVAASSAKVTSMIYDGHKVFVVGTINEKNHGVYDTYDVATGALLRRRGPNTRTIPQPGCTFPSVCVPQTVYEAEEWSVDGFGRVTEHRVATDAASGGGYGLAAIERTTYDDSSVPNRRLRTQRRELTSSLWVTSLDKLDGLGRLLTTTAYHQESGKPDRVSTYTYDAGGELREARVPDPRETTAYNAGGVSTFYERDGLGRVTRMVLPDGSGEGVVHVGGVTTTTPFGAGSGEPPGAVTETVHDARGRLRVVREHDNPTPGAIAVTEYGYDELDRMVWIRDADGNVTSMGYDHRGLRTAVTRGIRTWSYGYDLDGNLVTQTTPVPSGGVVAQYTSTSTYDELGRMLTFTPATRGMTTARLNQLGIGPISATYDVGANAVGQRVTLAQSGLFSTTYTYDVRRQLKREQRRLTLTQATHGAALDTTAWVDRTYNAMGAPLDVAWSTGQQWRYAYDGLGQSSSVAWRDPSTGQYKTLAAYTRTVAGPPRLRTSHWDQRRTWTYDVLGRVEADRVASGSGTTWAERGYGYDAFGRIGAVSSTIGSHHADAVYDYDGRGRVLSAEGPDAYSASFTYGRTGNVLSAKVSGALDAPARDVDYRYGARDPQAVDQLVDRATGAVVSSMGYDDAGNMTSRTGHGGSAGVLTWGGDDQLRETVGDVVERHYYAGPAQRIASVSATGVRVWLGELEQQFSTAGVLQASMHHVAMGEPIARIETGAATTVELQYADALQNLMLAMSTSNTVVASFIYGAFGEVVGETGAATHRRQFNGKEVDAASGLRFYGFRYYDPVALRWIAGDPLYRFAPDMAWAEPQRANLYAFSLNNPLTCYDPDGRDSKKKKSHDDDDTETVSTEVDGELEVISDSAVEMENGEALGYGVTIGNGSVEVEVYGAKAHSDEIQVASGVSTQTEAEALSARASISKDGIEVEASLAKVSQSVTLDLGLFSIELSAGLNAGVGGKATKKGVKMAALVELGATVSANKPLMGSIPEKVANPIMVRAGIKVLASPWAPFLVAD